MKNSRLIMLEGLPGTGKSTLAHFLYIQLEHESLKTNFVHEVSWPHPVLFFNEASLTAEEYVSFLSIHPHAEPFLNKIAVFDKNTVRVDLFEIEWNCINEIGISTYDDLRKYDVRNYSLEKYIDLALQKWAYFTEKALNDNNIVFIMDACIFQYQIFWFLLHNAPFKKIKQFILKLIEIINPLNPSLIYFYRENTLDTIEFLEKIRGRKFLEHIWERDKNSPYYNDKPEGAEGYKYFLKDYADIATKLFNEVGCRKTSIDIAKQDWQTYKSEVLSFLNAERKLCPVAYPSEGIFKNDELNQEIKVKGLLIEDPSGKQRILTPKSDCEFYVECLPVVLRFIEEKKIVMSGGQICGRWTVSGTVFEAE